MTERGSIIYLEGVVVDYDGFKALNNLNFIVNYNELRTHLSLGKDSPRRRQVQRLGQLAAQPILGGLHHQYCRM